MATGLEPSLCVHFYSQVRYPYNEFVHSIPSYFSKCIITTIRLSGSSWRTKTTFAPPVSRLTTLVLSIHVILHKQFTDMFRSPAEFKLKMYHYLHRPWYTKQIYYLPLLARTSIVQSMYMES